MFVCSLNNLILSEYSCCYCFGSCWFLEKRSPKIYALVFLFTFVFVFVDITPSCKAGVENSYLIFSSSMNVKLLVAAPITHFGLELHSLNQH